MEHYEKQYIEESGNETPRAENYKNCIAYDSAYIQWYKRFIDWLCKRLEKVENFQLEISDWQDETFPKANALSKMSHLAKEIIELNKTLVEPSSQMEIEEELADCQHLLFGIASKCGINLYEATRQKFEINKKRIWGKPDSNGVVEHIK
jgi:NTP pyrophosphatase (non-canonical NTP hydrolase)